MRTLGQGTMDIGYKLSSLCIFRPMAKTTIYRRLFEEKEEMWCLECGNRIRYGRTDKKFCSCECKNNFHNRTRHAESRRRQEIATVLKNNYSVLAWLLWSGRTNAAMGQMTERGFDPSVFTSSGKSGCHMEYQCYDIVYYMTRNKVFNVHRIEYGYAVNGYICKDKRH